MGAGGAGVVGQGLTIILSGTGSISGGMGSGGGQALRLLGNARLAHLPGRPRSA